MGAMTMQPTICMGMRSNKECQTHAQLYSSGIDQICVGAAQSSLHISLAQIIGTLTT